MKQETYINKNTPELRNRIMTVVLTPVTYPNETKEEFKELILKLI